MTIFKKKVILFFKHKDYFTIQIIYNLNMQLNFKASNLNNISNQSQLLALNKEVIETTKSII